MDTKSLRSWEDFPFDPRVGEGPTLKDTAPERTPQGDFILYHGTSRAGARAILRSRTILPDNLGYVGFGTTPSAVATYAAMKGPKGGSILRLVIDAAWFTAQDAGHEIGGSGRDQFLLKSHPRWTPPSPAPNRATIPSQAIKAIFLHRA